MSLALTQNKIMNTDQQSIVMELYLDLHQVQNTLSNENLELSKTRINFNNITSKIKFLVGNGRNNEIF